MTLAKKLFRAEASNLQVKFHSSTDEKTKFSIKDFSSKCDQICKKLRIWSHLLEKSLMKNFIFCAVINICSSNRSTSLYLRKIVKYSSCKVIVGNAQQNCRRGDNKQTNKKSNSLVKYNYQIL